MNIVFSERFDDALAFTHQLHRRQVTAGPLGRATIADPMSVAALVIEDGGTEDEAIAALLHDSLEDQGRHYPGGVAQLAQDIGARFGEEVLRIVQACTERTSEEEAAIRISASGGARTSARTSSRFGKRAPRCARILRGQPAQYAHAA